MSTVALRIMSFALILVLMGCFRGLLYSGDGQFTDNSFLSYSRRYVIDLGPVNLAEPGVYHYNLSGLPRAVFNVGIDIVEERPNQMSGVRPYHPTNIRLELRTSDDQIVIFEEGVLNAWVWSFGEGSSVSRLYQRGKSIDVPLSQDNVQVRRVGEKASGGWGTYFDSEPDGRYALTLTVLASDEYISRSARLIVNGWDRI